MKYVVELAAKMLVFTKEEIVKEIYFVTPIGVTRRVNGKWVGELDQESINRAVAGLDRFEVQWDVHSDRTAPEDVPFDHEIVEGFDNQNFNLKDFIFFLKPSPLLKGDQGPFFFDKKPSSKPPGFLEALETHDFAGARGRFKIMLEHAPDNSASRALIGTTAADEYLNRAINSGIVKSELAKAVQFGTALSNNVSENARREWYQIFGGDKKVPSLRI